MKRFLISFCFCIVLYASAASHAQAQIAQTRQSIDTDLLTLRNLTVPDFSMHYDDYLQYAPSAVMFGLKAFGYESRSSWERMLASDAFSIAAMAAAVNGLKYSVGRLRPDGSRYNSFPSGHTATAFMTATMLHKEYGWRNPLFSIGGYTAAAVTGVSRMLNNRHWMSDVVAGAAIGIGSVHLGYYLSDLIFRNKGLANEYSDPDLKYDPEDRHYVAELFFGRRYILGAEGRKKMGVLPERGSLVGLSSDIPLIPGLGVTARASASSMIYVSGAAYDMYSLLAGGFWNLNIRHILELQAKVMAGYAWMRGSGGADLAAGIGLSLITDSNFKVKAFVDLESCSLSPRQPWINTLVAGFSTAWFL